MRTGTGAAEMPRACWTVAFYMLGLERAQFQFTLLQTTVPDTIIGNNWDAEFLIVELESFI
jgi:hypothetical protein